MVWSEPGQNNTDEASSSWTKDSYGQWIHTKPRRFIVVRSHTQSCLVVPITSYGMQGVSKDKVKKSDHCIVYTGRIAPQPQHFEAAQRGEQPMQPFPIRIDPDELDGKLDDMSRIDFSRPRTVEHYSVVKNFGKVHPDSLHALVTQFQNVMDPSRALQHTATSRRPVSLLSARTKHMQAYSALVNYGWTQQEAVEYVNIVVRALGDDRLTAEESQSESEPGERSDDEV